MVAAIHRPEALYGARATGRIRICGDDRAPDSNGRCAAKCSPSIWLECDQFDPAAAGLFHARGAGSLQISGRSSSTADCLDVGGAGKRHRRCAGLRYQLSDHRGRHPLGRGRDESSGRSRGTVRRNRTGVDQPMKRETIAIHAGYEVDPTTKAVAVPIYQTVSYAFDSTEHAAALFNLEAQGFRYTRISNPTTAVLERRVAALEGGRDAMCVASGQAAVTYAVQNVTELGCNIISTPQLYGTTHTLFAHLLPSQGVGVRFAETDRPESVEKMIDHNTRAVFCESVGNPAGNVCDIEGLARVAHRHGVPLIVDNTVATPILLRPIEYGADIVVHSLTKFMGGHGTTLGGAIVDSGNFDWKEHVDRFPIFNQPDPSYHGLVYSEHFGKGAYLGRCRAVYQRTTGAVLSPLSSFLLLQGIETVALRVQRHVENGRKVAE